MFIEKFSFNITRNILLTKMHKQLLYKFNFRVIDSFERTSHLWLKQYFLESSDILL